MERVHIIKDICQQLGLPNLQNNWIRTLGDYLGVQELPGGDDYEQRVFTAAISNSEVNVSFSFNTKDHGNAFNSQTVGYNFTGDGVTLTNSIDNIVNVNIDGGGSSYKVYTALLTQTGTTAPVATVLENTLGVNITFSYQETGYYRFTGLQGVTLDPDKLFLQIVPTTDGEEEGPGDVFHSRITVNPGDTSEGFIFSNNTLGVAANGAFARTPIEIRVYN